MPVIDSEKNLRVGAFGEVMMRLAPARGLLLEQTHDVRLDFTGTGVNVLSALAHLGVRTELLTALPDNRVGRAARAELARLGCSTDHVLSRGDHLGTYVAELGFGARPTNVTYLNRLASSFCQCPPEAYDLEGFVESVVVVHICGIVLSLTDEAWTSALALAQLAHERGRRVCFDFNYRSSLNAHEGAPERYLERARIMLPLCDVVFGTAWDAARVLGLDESERGDALALLAERYGCETIAHTSRADGGGVQGHVLTWRDGTLEEACSRAYETQVLDRIGAGDAFAAGVIFGLCQGWDAADVAEFSAASHALACTTLGDAPLADRGQIEALVRGDSTEVVR